MGPHRRVIAPGANARGYWTELWARRDLIFHMAWRDILVRYKQTYLGFAWAVIQPFVVIVVMTLVFRRLARLPSLGEAPYPIMVFAALLPWQFFASSVSGIGGSIVGKGDMVRQVYFPRLILPITSVATAFHDLIIGLVILAIVMAAYGYAPDWRVVTLPLFLLFAALTAFALGIWVAVLNVYYRDFRFLVPYFLQVAMYISPVGFATSVVPMKWHDLYALNPMVGVIDGSRWALLRGGAEIHVTSLLISVAFVLVMLVAGVWFFRRKEGTFADRI